MLRSSAVASSPKKRRLRSPGAPRSASTSSPESSATVRSPLATAYERALLDAFAANVSPSSAGSGGTGKYSSGSTAL